MMAFTVVINGIPEYVTCSEVALNLEKIFCARVGPFHIRDLRHVRPISSWQFALDFNYLCDASIAQKLLHCYDYVLNNGEGYVLFAKVTADPNLKKPEVSVIPAVRSRSSSYDEDCAILGLVPKISDDELYRRCSNMDAQIEYMNKQKILLQAETDFLRERRQLWREYKRMNDMDESRRSRSPRNYCRSRSRHRSRSRSRRASRSIVSNSRNHTPRLSTSTDLKESSRSNFNTSNHLTFGMVFHQSQNHSSSENTIDETISGYHHIDIDINSEITNKVDTKKHKPKVLNIKIEKSEATKRIIKEMDSMLDKICYEKNINILEKGVNLNVIKKLKDAVKKRLENLKITNDMASDTIVSCYRHVFSKNDDRKIIETFLNEYVVSNPHIQNKSVCKYNSSESSYNICDTEDNNMWLAVEEILQDVKIEPLSSEDGDEDNITIVENKSKLVEQDEPKVTEVIDLTHEPLIVSEYNTQVEMIVIVKTNNRQIVSVEENKQIINQEEETRNEEPTDGSQHSGVDDIKWINRKPSFFIATKSLMRKMKSIITEIAPIDSKRFTDVVEKDIKNKIMTLLKGKEYMKTAKIIQLFKEHHPKENYKEFLKCVAEGLKFSNLK